MRRICAICRLGRKPAEIYAFDEILRTLEIEGRYAHPTCVMDAQADQKARTLKYGGSHVDLR